MEDAVRRAVNRFGIDLHRYRPERSESARLSAMLTHHHVRTVLDVGANEGQFARSLRTAKFAGRIVSFEPLSNAHARLLSASAGNGLWTVAPRSAIGDTDGEAEIHIAGNSVSSSLLDMHNRHLTAAADSGYTGAEKVRLARLDTIRAEIPAIASPLFLKIDTQGYEDKVLDGAPDVLRDSVGLQLEMSFVTLYQGQQLFDALLDRVRSAGFSIWAIWPGVCDQTTGRMLQVDVVLFRD